jgi:hypothetical protein
VQGFDNAQQTCFESHCIDANGINSRRLTLYGAWHFVIAGVTIHAACFDSMTERCVLVIVLSLRSREIAVVHALFCVMDIQLWAGACLSTDHCHAADEMLT